MANSEKVLTLPEFYEKWGVELDGHNGCPCGHPNGCTGEAQAPVSIRNLAVDIALGNLEPVGIEVLLIERETVLWEGPEENGGGEADVVILDLMGFRICLRVDADPVDIGLARLEHALSIVKVELHRRRAIANCLTAYSEMAGVALNLQAMGLVSKTPEGLMRQIEELRVQLCRR